MVYVRASRLARQIAIECDNGRFVILGALMRFHFIFFGRRTAWVGKNRLGTLSE